LHIRPSHPSHVELAFLVVEKQPLARFFPSQASSPHFYGYLEDVAPWFASLTYSLQVQAS
jgi:hypothetical protein